MMPALSLLCSAMIEVVITTPPPPVFLAQLNVTLLHGPKVGSVQLLTFETDCSVKVSPRYLYTKGWAVKKNLE